MLFRRSPFDVWLQRTGMSAQELYLRPTRQTSRQGMVSAAWVETIWLVHNWAKALCTFGAGTRQVQAPATRCMWWLVTIHLSC